MYGKSETRKLWPVSFLVKKYLMKVITIMYLSYLHKKQWTFSDICLNVNVTVPSDPDALHPVSLTTLHTP